MVKSLRAAGKSKDPVAPRCLLATSKNEANFSPLLAAPTCLQVKTSLLWVLTLSPVGFSARPFETTERPVDAWVVAHHAVKRIHHDHFVPLVHGILSILGQTGLFKRHKHRAFTTANGGRYDGDIMGYTRGKMRYPPVIQYGQLEMSGTKSRLLRRAKLDYQRIMWFALQ